VRYLLVLSSRRIDGPRWWGLTIYTAVVLALLVSLVGGVWQVAIPLVILAIIAAPTTDRPARARGHPGRSSLP